MTNDYIVISDFLSSEIEGGAELNDKEIIKILSINHSVLNIKSRNVTMDFLEKKQKENFIVSNFTQLPKQCKMFLEKKCKYIIYEHDHKYLVRRDPAKYKNFIAPEEEIINASFYRNAIAVMCQSNFHKSIIYKNLQIDNLHNLSGNMWSDETLNLLEALSSKEKKDRCSVMESKTHHKNTKAAIAFCKHKNLLYDLIPHMDYHSFLNTISDNNKLIFFPKTPETLSRVVVECRMMGMKVTTNSLVGAAGEPWFELKGKDLISYMKNKKNEIALKIEGNFKNV